MPLHMPIPHPLHAHRYPSQTIDANATATEQNSTQNAGDSLAYQHLDEISGPPGPFPAELWMQIIEEDSSKNEWVVLSQTCRFFHQIAQPCIYKRVTLYKHHNPGSGKNHLSRSFSLFERSFKHRPELGALVHGLSLHVDALPPWRDQVTRPLVYQLDQFPNLETLVVQAVNIEANLCYALHSHPRLRSLELEYCAFDDQLGEADFRDFAGSSISKMDFFDPGNNYAPEDGFWTSVAPIRLQSLTVLSGYIPLGRLDLIFLSIMIPGKNRMLEKLSINFLPSSLVDFLVTSPQIRHLTINCPINPDHPLLSSLPAAAIPRLEHYAGPVELCGLMLQNRPVHTVGLLHSKTKILGNGYADIFDPLQFSSVPITTLDVLTGPVRSWLWHVPITIDNLTFNLEKDDFMMSLRALSRLTSLHTIRGTGKGAKEKGLSQADIVIISEACPSLRVLELSYERWMMMKPNVWEHFT